MDSVSRNFEQLQRCLSGGPREVLHRLMDGDPLGIRERALARLRERAFLLDPEHVVARSIARAAYAAGRYGGRPSLDRWLDQRIDEAIDDLLTEQQTEELQRIPAAQTEDERYYRRFAKKTRIELGASRLACVVLNELSGETRRAFVAVGLEGKTVHRHVAEGNGPPQRVQRLLRGAAERVLLVLASRPRRGRAGRGEGIDPPNP